MYLGKLEHGKVIRRLRMERQLSIEDVAELIDEDPKFLRELEEEMYPDIEFGIFFYLARAFEMKPSALIIEIEKDNIDFLNRSQIYQRNKYELTKQRDKQRNLVLQKKRSHNFKNKHPKHQSNKKININENKPTASIINLCKRYEIIP
ncbi:helix-turn-helix domain-containing protein [Neobacillus niacini]|uniref:helix-turn-helix domain-containing protein n=1 Tax=Neobacillus niacini TaxID=86668 RepID=UPI00203E48B3|nr:helix-turn-helix transcriptional regulator [Neobacillus niacini]MCM3691801.1 helix-turn-helix domain-containing protein [Neobacillus niacini]